MVVSGASHDEWERRLRSGRLLEMGLHRAVCHEQALGDLRVGVSRHHQVDDLPLGRLQLQQGRVRTRRDDRHEVGVDREEDYAVSRIRFAECNDGEDIQRVVCRCWPASEEERHGVCHDARRRGDLLQGLGRRPTVVLSHGWPLSSDSWDGPDAVPRFDTGSAASPTTVAVTVGPRRRGTATRWTPTRTISPTVIEALDLRDVALVGFSTGGGEVARYIGRHGSAGSRRSLLISAVPPFMLRTEDNPDGVPSRSSTGSARARRRPGQTFRDLADGPFFGRNRPGANVSPGCPGRLLVAGHAIGASQCAGVHHPGSAVDGHMSGVRLTRTLLVRGLRVG